jgi:hypothetical protein
MISIEFQSIDNDPGIPQKKNLFSFNCYNIGICLVTFVLHADKYILPPSQIT